MRSTLEADPANGGYAAKEGRITLIKVHPVTSEAEILGEALVNLSDYTDCTTRRGPFSAQLSQCRFADAYIEFFVTARPVSGNQSILP